MTKPKWFQLMFTVLLTLVAVVLSLYLFQDQLSSLLVRNNKVTVSVKTVHEATTRPKKAPTYDFQSVKPLSLASLSAAAVSKHNVAAVGKLVIPEIDLNLPIALGVGNTELAFAAGTLNDGQKMGEGNYALAGHHMANDESVLFGPLVKSHVGMTAYVSDMTSVYIYQVYARSYIRATDVQVLDETANPELTLVTCDDDGTGRLLVQSRLIAKLKFQAAPTALKKLINQES